MEEYQAYSLRGRVFQSIRENILNGVYEENEELRENTIAKELGVSRTPVREALRQLEYINQEMRAISALMHLNYNMIDGRNRDKVKVHFNNIVSYGSKYDKIKNTIVASDIRFSKLPEIPVIEPIYHQIGGITSNQIRTYIWLKKPANKNWLKQPNLLKIQLLMLY